MMNGIDEYLGTLQQVLHLRPRLKARILAEVEDHLREAAQQQEERGASPEEAQRAAIERFGSPQRIAQRFQQELAAARARAIIKTTLLALGGLAILAIALFISKAGTDWLAANPAGPNSPDFFAISSKLAIVAALAFSMSAGILMCGSFGRRHRASRRFLAVVMLGFTLWSVVLAQRAWSTYPRFTLPPGIKAPPGVVFGIWPSAAIEIIDQFQLLSWLLLGLISLLLVMNIGKITFAPYLPTKGIARCLIEQNSLPLPAARSLSSPRS